MSNKLKRRHLTACDLHNILMTSQSFHVLALLHYLLTPCYELNPATWLLHNQLFPCMIVLPTKRLLELSFQLLCKVANLNKVKVKTRVILRAKE